MKIDLLSGPEARSWIRGQAIREQWKNLYARCPWGTVCQAEEFVLPWYETYESRYSPVVVFGTEVNGELTGLFTLAVDNDTGELIVAGSAQAEYHTWLADPRDESAFIIGALQALRGEFPVHVLRLHFLAPSTPLDWLHRGPWARQCELRDFQRPLAATTDAAIFRHHLEKKRYKARRLARAGEMRLERITSVQDFEPIFDIAITFGSFRHAAVHDVRPRRDPLKKQFYAAMMAVPRLLHVTALRVGDRVVSTHLGFYNRNQVILGMIAHSPAFARQSPSWLHLYMLGEKLAEEGIEALDLTPGGEYKEQLATHHDTAHGLTIFFSARRRFRYQVQRKLVAAAKHALELTKLTPEQAKDIAAQLKHRVRLTKVSSLPAKLLKVGRQRLWRSLEMRIYSYDVGRARELTVSQPMKRDCLPDLLAYQPAEPWQMRYNVFLKRALKGLEGGNHVYTCVEQERLVHYGWLVERQDKSHLAEVGHDFYLPPDSAVLTDFYTHPVARGKGMYQQSLPQMLHDAALIRGTKHIFIGVLADNGPSRHVIEKLGFEYRFSFFARTIGTKTKRWSNAPPEFTTPPAA
jgi:CelD/BcsL family acetyltransferase involved in cellulose biosynthesis